MPIPLQVSLQRAGWVSGFVPVLVLLVLACLVYVMPDLLAVTTVLLVGLCWRRLVSWWKKPALSPLFLHIDRHGQWCLIDPDRPPQVLILQHIWRASAWVTLRFIQIHANGSRQTVQYTVWRSVIEPDVWRRLQIMAAYRTTPLSATTSTEGS